MAGSEHFLYRPRQSPWPKAVVTLYTEVKWLQDVHHAGREHGELCRWCVAVATPAATGYIVSRTASGATSAGFWDGLRECAERARGITLICANTRQSASVLDLWGGMENGEVIIAGRDQRNRKQARGLMPNLQGRGATDNVAGQCPLDAGQLPPLRVAMGEEKGNSGRHGANPARRPSGIMILQDPPIVMELQLRGCPWKITWSDVANYGLDSSAQFGDSNETATRIATWFCGCASILKGLGDAGWQNTAGSQAMHLYRRTYLDTAILSHTHPVASSLERAALFGGRCECFRLGKIPGNVHLYDVRSMYPYICSHLPLPVRLLRVVARPTKAEIYLLRPDTFALAEVAIETETPDYPVRRGNEVIYPTGRYWTYLAGAELQFALRSQHVRGVRRLALYEVSPALARYAQEIYALRCTNDRSGNEAVSAWIKRLLVSVVGKFAQSERRWVDYPNGESAFEWGEWHQLSGSGECERWRSIAGHLQREELGGWSHGSVPAITAAITSAGRVRLRAIMDAAGRQHTIYCDTDAVIVDDFGAEQLAIAGWVRPGEWGYLQHVESAVGCTITGDKNYRIGARVRAAGCPAGSDCGGTRNDNGASQPWIGWSMLHQQRPADWRESHERIGTDGRYAGRRSPGGEVKAIELWEW